MRYTIKRIAPHSALRVGLALGWLVALPPAMVLAWLGMRALQAVNARLSQIEPTEISVLGQPLARLDWLDLLGVSSTARTIAQLVDQGLLTFLGITLVVTLAGAVLFLVIMMLFALAYNLLAASIGGLEVELDARPEQRS